MKRMLPPTLLLYCLLAMILLRLLLPIGAVIPMPFNLLGLVPLILGIVLSSAGSHRFSAVGTNIKTFDEPDKLVTDGLFRFSRNPMYLGFIVVLVGIWILMESLTPLLGVFAFAAITDRWYVPFEEKMLAQKFGSAFERYKLQTRRWL